ncbi:MAG TPA: MFS transporter [Thermoplasmataceae archaeon]|nr:MFS transporter [Thermoplasmatales archaeon AK]HLH86126.1 MFS transporter [Thermoplasmataceae archaeon]
MGEGDEASKLLEALDTTKTGRFHYKTVFIAGMGFFSDAYDLFVTSTAIPIITSVFLITSGNNIFGTAYIGPLSAASVETGLIGSMALFGAFVGALIFGRIADLKGRRYIYGLEMSILVAFAIISALSINVQMLLVSRFILGVGIGGDYPVSSTIMSEYANVRNRGRMVLMVFAMQGFGLLLGTLVGLVSVRFFSLDIAWRVMLGFGAIPASTVIYLRRRIRESPRFSLQVKGSLEDARKAVESVTGTTIAVSNGSGNGGSFKIRGILRKYWITLLGTAGSWFILDMAYYGTSVNSGNILKAIGYGAVAGDLHQTILNIAVGNAILAAGFAIPGYWFAVATIDRVGRKTLQWAGFAVMSAIYLVFAVKYDSILTNFALFLVLYGLSYFFTNAGPNSTTFILPTELFPTSIRTTGHGISASSGKLGAGIFTFLIPVMQVIYGLPTVMYVLASVAFFGAILTVFTISETKNQPLEVSSAFP